MQQETTTRASAVPIRSGIVMLSGYGIKVAVERRHSNRQRRDRPAAPPRPLCQGDEPDQAARRPRADRLCDPRSSALAARAKAAFIQLDHDWADLDGIDRRLGRCPAATGAGVCSRTPSIGSRSRASSWKPKIKGQMAVLDSFASTAPVRCARRSHCSIAPTASTTS